jgi:hypothetical protein
MAKKKTFKAPEADKQELEDFRKHIKTTNEKTKAISDKYKMWWDSDKKTWKKNFKHGEQDG